ncbi:MAG: alanine racemase [Rhodospirillales bacterium]
MSDRRRAGAVLTIDLDAVAANYRRLRDRAAPAECAAVVKADAYGLGAAAVGPVLAAAGCRTFFVAHVDEGIALRKALARPPGEGASRPEPAVYVLNGLPRGAETTFARHRLTPVLNALADVDPWAAFARRSGQPRDAALHVDTGMSRLGLPPADRARLAADPGRLDGIRVRLLMSHLACADEPDHPLNVGQRDAFLSLRRGFPDAAGSLANSAGIFLGDRFHADVVRPGAALYGLAPVPGRPNPMAQVVRLQGKILQIREIDSPETVGYGATHRARGRETIATVAVGYADGYSRALSNRGSAFIGDVRVPLVGRVSMDLITFDVSAVPPAMARPGMMVDLIGSRHPVDALAAEAGTIGYEILTALGARYHRVYTRSKD